MSTVQGSEAAALSKRCSARRGTVMVEPVGTVTDLPDTVASSVPVMTLKCSSCWAWKCSGGRIRDGGADVVVLDPGKVTRIRVSCEVGKKVIDDRPPS